MTEGRAMKEEKKQDKLTASDRKAMENIVTKRFQTMESTLKDELNSDEAELTSKILRDKGYILTEDELDEQLSVVEVEIDDIMKKVLEQNSRIMDIEIEELKEQRKDQMTRLKREFAEKEQQIKDEFDKLIEEKSRGREEAKENLTNEHCAGLLGKKKYLLASIEQLKAANVFAREIAKETHVFLSKNKSRIINTLKDKRDKIHEKIYTATFRSEVSDMLESLPSVDELVQSCQSPDRIAELMGRINPNMPLFPFSVKHKNLALPEPSKINASPVTDTEKVLESEATISIQSSLNEVNDEDDYDDEDEDVVVASVREVIPEGSIPEDVE